MGIQFSGNPGGEGEILFHGGPHQSDARIVDVKFSALECRGDGGNGTKVHHVERTQRHDIGKLLFEDYIETGRPRGKDATDDLVALRLALSEPEQDDLADLGHDAAAALQSALAGWRPGERDLDIQARLAAALEATGADAIAGAARQIAETLDLAAVICWTSSGATGLRVAREPTRPPIVAISPKLSTGSIVIANLPLRWVAQPTRGLKN